MDSNAQSIVDWGELLGRCHPALVHLPIGLVAALALIELFGFGDVSGRYVITRRATFVFSALMAGITATSGWSLAETGGYDPDLLAWHRWLSVALFGVLLLTTLADLFGSSGLWRRAGVVLAMALVVVSGHQGGSLTHGSTYLTRNAPPWFVRAVEAITPATYLPGEPAEDETAPAEQEPGESEAGDAADGARGPVAGSGPDGDAQVILDFIESRCVRCHGPDKRKAGLRLDQRDGRLSVIDEGAAPDSELYRRVTLPEGHGDEMPTDGPLLDDAQIASLRRWINAGAPPLEGEPGASDSVDADEPAEPANAGASPDPESETGE